MCAKWLVLAITRKALLPKIIPSQKTSQTLGDLNISDCGLEG